MSSSRRRQSRLLRRRRGAIRLQARDRELLHLLARLRIARTGDLAALCFAGLRRDTVNGRLRALFDAGYLDVSMPDRTADNLYSLGEKGRALIREAGEEVAAVPRGGLAHHLAVVRTWVAVASAKIPGWTLELARPDWELRGEFGDRSTVIVPDLFAAFGGRGDLALAVEVDLGTEPLHVVRDKLRLYDELAVRGSGLFGWRDFSVCLAVASDGRRKELNRLLASEWRGVGLLWDLAEGPEQALRKFFNVPLTRPPYGKGAVDRLSGGSPTENQSERRGLSEE